MILWNLTRHSCLLLICIGSEHHRSYRKMTFAKVLLISQRAARVRLSMVARWNCWSLISTRSGLSNLRKIVNWDSVTCWTMICCSKFALSWFHSVGSVQQCSSSLQEILNTPFVCLENFTQPSSPPPLYMPYTIFSYLEVWPTQLKCSNMPLSW